MISEVTRRNIIDFLVRERICWHGRLDEIEFLSRIYKLDALPSTDIRKEFPTARDDIRQHRIRNPDWEDDWIFSDDRFGLLKGEDALFLRFLAEMLHPVVRPDPIEVNNVVDVLNANLRVDGFELTQNGKISGRPIFVGQSMKSANPSVERAEISPERGGEKDCESGQFEDGTNVAIGTRFLEEPLGRFGGSWYVPMQSKASGRWKENFTKLRTRFDRIIDEFCTTECFLVQTLIPAFDIASTKPPGILPDRQLLLAGGGLRREPARLIMPQKPPVGIFPMMNVRGEPMIETDGKPVAFRLGLSRYISVYAIPDGSRPLPIPQLTELIGDGRNLLYQLPPEIADRIWRNWKFGFSQSLNNDAHSLWLDALFEMSWQRRRGSPFHTERYAWHENGSVALSGSGLFPRLPQFITSTPGDFVTHEHGYPRAFYSKISDVARASVAAIDEILDCGSLVSDADLGEPVASKPQGQIATELKWSILSPADFERLIFNVIDHTKEYENPKWLTHTNAPDKGRDLSVERVLRDSLAGSRKQRVILACKHTKSVNLKVVSELEAQMKLWEPPKVDELIIVTTGRFTTDAIDYVEKHNIGSNAMRIEMWPDSHLERLLARRPELIAKFRLRN